MEVLAVLMALAFFAWLYLTREKKADAPQPPVASAPVVQPSPAPQSEPPEFAFIDLETTGLDPSEDRIIEVAVLFYREGATTFNGYSGLANPGVAIPERITELTGITTAMVSENDSTGNVVAKFLDRIGDRPIVAYNAEFDMAFLRREAGRIGRSVTNKSHCLMEYTKERHPNLRRYRLQDVCAAFDVDAPTSLESGLSPHRAMFDAERAVRLYIALRNGRMPKEAISEEPANYSRRLDHGNNAKYHGIRSSAKLLQQEAKALEATDIERAIHSYQSALKLHIESAKVQIFFATRPDNTQSLFPESGDIECINRLTMCLCKNGKATEARTAMQSYFDVFPKDAALKTAEQIRKRVEKAVAKI